MEDCKRKFGEIDVWPALASLDQPSEKRHRLEHHIVPEPAPCPSAQPLPSNPSLDQTSKPSFLTLFRCLVPFQDRLRESGCLTAYDYTRLRMTCRTIAHVWRPFPIHPLEPEPRDPYFAGLRPVKCDDLYCANTSDLVPIRRCYGKHLPKVFSGCNRFVCLFCVERAQQSHDLDQSTDTELHHCRSCTDDVQFNPRRLACQCGFKHRGEIAKQTYADWQCSNCRSAGFRALHLVALKNLRDLEDSCKIRPRDRRCDTYSLQRWVSENTWNRNCCPGCAKTYPAILSSYPESQITHQYPFRRWMLRMCVVCLGYRN